MTIEDILKLVPVAKVRKATGDTPWILVAIAVLTAGLPTALGVGHRFSRFSFICHVAGAVLGSVGIAAAILNLVANHFRVQLTPTLLAGALLGLVAGSLGATLGFAREAGQGEFVYRVAVVSGLSAPIGAAWLMAIQFFRRRTDWTKTGLAAFAVFTAVLVGVAAVVAVVAADGIDSFNQGITTFQMALVSASFVALKSAWDAITTSSGRRIWMVRLFVLAPLLVLCLVATRRTDAASVSVFLDDPYPKTTMAGMILVVVVGAMVCDQAARVLSHLLCKPKGK